MHCWSGSCSHLTGVTCAKDRGGKVARHASVVKVMAEMGDKRADGFINDSDGKSHKTGDCILFSRSLCDIRAHPVRVTN